MQDQRIASVARREIPYRGVNYFFFPPLFPWIAARIPTKDLICIELGILHRTWA